MVLRKGAPSSVIRKRLYMNQVLIDSSNLFVFDTSGQTKTLQLNNVSQCVKNIEYAKYTSMGNDLGGKKKDCFGVRRLSFAKFYFI